MIQLPGAAVRPDAPVPAIVRSPARASRQSRLTTPYRGVSAHHRADDARIAERGPGLGTGGISVIGPFDSVVELVRDIVRFEPTALAGGDDLVGVHEHGCFKVVFGVNA